MSLVLVSSLDVLLDVHREIVPIVPLFSAHVRENPKWPQLVSTHMDHHSTHVVDVLASDSLSHECRDGYTDHIV